MTETPKILALIGSLRKGSMNRATALAAREMLAPEVDLVLYALHELPFYDGDVEDAGDPAAVTELKAAVRASAGVIMFMPEYNGSFSAVAKNALDWLSRKRDDEAAPLKTAAVTAVITTPGGRAGAGLLGHLDNIMPHLCERYFGEALGIGQYGRKFDAQRKLTDAATRTQLAEFLERFVRFCTTDP